MGKQFRFRVHAKQAPGGKIRKGNTSSSCPSYSKNREMAKLARASLRQRLVPIDERPRKEPKRRPQIDALAEPLEDMGIENKQEKKKQLKRALSITSLLDDDEKEMEVKKPKMKKVAEIDPNMTILANNQANLALQELQSDTIGDERKLRIVDKLIVLCRHVGSDSATKILDHIHPWFLSDPKRKSLQKKAYRILSELYKRHDDPQLAQFFEYIKPTVGDILRLEVKQIAETAWAPRLAVFRSVLRSLDTLEACEQFYNTVFSHIIVGMDRDRNSLARRNAARCFSELVIKMRTFCEDKEEKETLQLQVLDSIESRIFEHSGFSTKSSEIALETVRAVLIAMNIFAQQHLKHMNGALVSRFLNHSVVFLADSRPVIRVLAIRLMRVFCRKMAAFVISQFQDYILESVFSNQSEDEITGTIRRANRSLFEVLIEKFSYDVVCKYAQGQEGNLKVLKNLEKKRRRKLAPMSGKSKKSARSTVNEDDSESEEDDKMTSVSQARTICADSIFKLLEESDEADSDEDSEDGKSRVAQSMISIKEFRKALQRSETVAAQKVDKSKKLPKGLHIAEDGRIVVEDLEAADDEDESDAGDDNEY